MSSSEPPHLSLVFPVYNQEALLEKSLEKTLAYLASKSYSAEVIAVEDASKDGSAEILRKFESRLGGPARFSVVANPSNRGKGYSVRQGVKAAKGRYVVFMDIDLAYPFENVDHILGRLENGCDVAIACRTLPESVYIMSPSFFHYLYTRHLMSRFFNAAVRLWLGVPTHDTQAGLKGFTRAAAEKIFSRQRINGFSFDVEVLFIARRLGLSVQETPVSFRYFDEPSTVNLVRDAAKMLYDLWRVRWWGWIGRYDA